MSIRQEIRRIKVVQEGRAIHHTRTGIQPRDLVQPTGGDQLSEAFTGLRSGIRVGGDGGFDFGEVRVGAEGFGEFLGEGFGDLEEYPLHQQVRERKTGEMLT